MDGVYGWFIAAFRITYHVVLDRSELLVGGFKHVLLLSDSIK